METLTSIFNTAGSVATWVGYAAAVVVPVTTGWFLLTKGPRQLKPENETAVVITARHWPNVLKKDKIVARNGAEMYLKWGASKESQIPLGTFRVEVQRKGKDLALTLEDKVKAEVNAEFFVRVDSSTNESIIKALESLGGKIDEEKIKEYCTPKFDAALRAAAAKMQIEQIQTEREQFRTSVKEALDSLKDDGLFLVDVALRQLNQSPLEDFDPNNFFDAQGLKKVTQTIYESKKIINDTEQNATTLIQARNKDEEIKRLSIAEEQRKATLEQNERVKQMEAEQAKRVASIQASNDKEAQEARIAAEQAVDQARITKERQVGVAAENKEREIAVARADREKVAGEAEIAKKIVLHAKAGEEADAEKAANERRAEAASAEESVKTARQVAEANRSKQIEVIEAEAAAQRSAASERIAADTKVYVAQKAREEATEQAEAIRIEAKAAQDAAKLAAEGAYAEIFQKAKAVADGKMEEAKAQEAINKAINALTDEAKAHLQNMARISMTPEAIKQAMAKIDGVNITSLNGGLPGMFGGAAAGGAEGADAGAIAGNPISQMLQAIMMFKMAEPMMEKVIGGVGGDKGIAKQVPGDFNAAAAGEEPAAIVAPKAPAPAKAAPEAQPK